MNLKLEEAEALWKQWHPEPLRVHSALHDAFVAGTNAGVAWEREECARVAEKKEDEEAKYSSNCLQAAGGKSAAWAIAEDIRARGKEEECER